MPTHNNLVKVQKLVSSDELWLMNVELSLRQIVFCSCHDIHGQDEVNK